MNGCPACDNPVATLLGTLGNRTWFRCPACGADFSQPYNPEEDFDDDPGASVGAVAEE